MQLSPLLKPVSPRGDGREVTLDGLELLYCQLRPERGVKRKRKSRKIEVLMKKWKKQVTWDSTCNPELQGENVVLLRGTTKDNVHPWLQRESLLNPAEFHRPVMHCSPKNRGLIEMHIHCSFHHVKQHLVHHEQRHCKDEKLCKSIRQRLIACEALSMQEVTEVANVIRDLNDTIPLSGRPFIMTASSRDPTIQLLA